MRVSKRPWSIFDGYFPELAERAISPLLAAGTIATATLALHRHGAFGRDLRLSGNPRGGTRFGLGFMLINDTLAGFSITGASCQHDHRVQNLKSSLGLPNQ